MSSSLRQRIAARRRLYLVRHGEVSYFDARGKPYPERGVPLNEEGAAQARALAEALAGIPLDRVVATGLPRTQQTAAIIAGGPHASIETCEALREVTPGRLSELRDASGGDPAAASFERVFTGALGQDITRESRFLGGETFGAFADRVLPAFEGILASPGWKHLLVVAHGGTNRLILLRALGGGLASMGKLEQDPGCLNVIDAAPDGSLLVRLMNYTPYEPLKKGMHMTTMEKIFLDYQEKLSFHAERGEEA
jgi:probable phosphoglycerate mutase